MIDVYYTALKQTWTLATVNERMRVLPDELQAKNLRYRFWEDRCRHLLGKLMLVEGLRRYKMDKECLKQLRYNRYGRPSLDGTVDFNISHSGEHVVCVVANHAKVGVDIEKRKPVDFKDFTNVMSRVQWMRIKGSADPTRTFFDYWAAKESVIKADGRGMSAPVRDICIEDKRAILEGKEWFLTSPSLFSDSSFCIASDRPLPIRISRVNL